jgi:hypothetical protein
MARPFTDTLSADQKATLAELTQAINDAEKAKTDATVARHDLWIALCDAGHSQSEVARASKVIRQAVGWALTHRQEVDGRTA